MTGKYDVVAVKFRELETCKAMINMHCIYHYLALACAEKIFLDFLSFYKNSPKQLKTYIKVTLEVKNFEEMPKWQKEKLVPRVKKAQRTRWLGFQASVDSVYQEYIKDKSMLLKPSKETHNQDQMEMSY